MLNAATQAIFLRITTVDGHRACVNSQQVNRITSNLFVRKRVYYIHLLGNMLTEVPSTTSVAKQFQARITSTATSSVNQLSEAPTRWLGAGFTAQSQIDWIEQITAISALITRVYHRDNPL